MKIQQHTKLVCLMVAVWVSATGLAQGLKDRSTIILEQQGAKFRITLIMARHFLGQVDGTKDSDLIANYFQKSLGRSLIYLGNKACEWGEPSGNLSAEALYMQAIAFCMEKSPSATISWNIDYLHDLPEHHHTSVNLLVGDRTERLMFNRSKTLLSYHPVPMNEAFAKGLSFIGFAPKAWMDAYGEFALPLGLWLLCFTLYLNLAENRLTQGRRVTIVYSLFLTLALMASFLWEWRMDHSLATHGIFLSMSLYFILQWYVKSTQIRYLILAIVGTVHGGLCLSILPSLPSYFGTTTLFASFQVGAILGIWLGILLIGPCLKWLIQALPYHRRAQKTLKVLVFIISAVMLLI